MGYYCTVPQCTSLAGKTKNVKFHRFPRDIKMAEKWNMVLKRNKPYTKYSKVCSLHFNQDDYNVTHMGQWKTLNKDAVPSLNLPRLNPDGTLMVIRKSRKLRLKECLSPKKSEWSPSVAPLPQRYMLDIENEIPYRFHNLFTSSNAVENATPNNCKGNKQDAIMQTDPVSTDDDESPTNTSSEVSDQSYTSDMLERLSQSREAQRDSNYSNSPGFYVPQTNEEYNKEAERYALERKPNYEKIDYQKSITVFQKSVEFEKSTGVLPQFQKQTEPRVGLPPLYQKDSFTQYHQNGYQKTDSFTETRSDPFNHYQSSFVGDAAEVLRHHQQNLQTLQQGHSSNNQNLFSENHIKQEVVLSVEDESYLHYNKDQLCLSYEQQRQVMQQRLMEGQAKTDFYEAQVKTEPEANGACDTGMQNQDGTFYPTVSHNDNNVDYFVTAEMTRPGPEMLIAKQNALAAHTQLWQNTMKRPFFYSESSHCSGTQYMHSRYEESITSIVKSFCVAGEPDAALLPL